MMNKRMEKKIQRENALMQLVHSLSLTITHQADKLGRFDIHEQEFGGRMHLIRMHRDEEIAHRAKISQGERTWTGKSPSE